MLKRIENKNLNIKFENTKVTTKEKIDKSINLFWNKCKTLNPNLYNGELICVKSIKIKNNKIIINCQKTSYAHHLYSERIGIKKKYGCNNLVGGCLLETNDNYYIIGEMSKTTSVPNYLQIPGGNVDNNDIDNRTISIHKTIIREVKEELNINLKDKKQVKKFEIKYLFNNKKNTCLFINC